MCIQNTNGVLYYDWLKIFRQSNFLGYKNCCVGFLIKIAGYAFAGALKIQDCNYTDQNAVVENVGTTTCKH